MMDDALEWFMKKKRPILKNWGSPNSRRCTDVCSIFSKARKKTKKKTKRETRKEKSSHNAWFSFSGWMPQLQLVNLGPDSSGGKGAFLVQSTHLFSFFPFSAGIRKDLPPELVGRRSCNRCSLPPSNEYRSPNHCIPRTAYLPEFSLSLEQETIFLFIEIRIHGIRSSCYWEASFPLNRFWKSFELNFIVFSYENCHNFFFNYCKSIPLNFEYSRRFETCFRNSHCYRKKWRSLLSDFKLFLLFQLPSSKS